MRKKEIILGVTGSVAVYKSLELISRLKAKDFNVTAVMTKEAQEFITPLSFQTLCENPVYTEMFVLPQEFALAHVSLADKADLILVCPATASIIGKLASGICDDLLTCTVVSSKAPVVICPAMNDNMYKNKIVQENIAKLKKHGYRFVGPIQGRLACGRLGIGHLAPLKDIIQSVLTELK